MTTALLPLHLIQVRLRFTAPARFHFLHGGAVHGLLCQALGHDLTDGLVPFAPESGRVRFADGEAYHLGLTLFGEGRRLAEGLAAALRRVGAPRPASAGGPPVTLGGNFEVESVEVVAEVTADGIAALAADLGTAESVTLRFLSPLRLERSPADVRPGARFVNGEAFPAGLFLKRLEARFVRLATGRFPAPGELLPLPSDVVARPVGPMPWVDLPLTGRPEARPGRASRMTLGGVVGLVAFSALSEPWLERLALGRFLHAGQSPGYGLGRYALGGANPTTPELFPPARCGTTPDPFDRAAQQAAATVLGPAIDTLLEDSSAAYRRGFSRAGAARALASAVQEGFHDRLDRGLEALYPEVDLDRLAATLRALFPLESWAESVAAWLAPPASMPGARRRGLAPESPLSPWLVRLALDPLAEFLGSDRRLIRQGPGFQILSRHGGAASGQEGRGMVCAAPL